MYQSEHDKNVTKTTKLWFGLLHWFAKQRPKLHSFQGSLPSLPVPTLEETLKKHLKSMRPIMNDTDYDELVDLTEKFQKGLGRRLQRYLILKSWMSINYISDWWFEFVYLRQRSPIMINSNYYGFESVNEPLTKNQAARAANVTWGSLQYRRYIDRQELSPYSVNFRSKVPFCTSQYDRMFNSCRIPGEEVDQFCHWDDAKHVAVYCQGCWFKLPIHNGKRLLEPCELQMAYQKILDGELTPAPGEDKLAALTAGERAHWAITRKTFFSNGINKTSLEAIERAAFVVILDDEECFYDQDDSTKLEHWAKSLLHGKGYNRWFDKSFNIIISKNCRVGTNAEHSWGDAPLIAQLMENFLLKDLILHGYDENGNTRGTPEVCVQPQRLRWELNEEVQERINKSLSVANELINDVEMGLFVWTEFGKGHIKKWRFSPDAFMQMALQLTYFRNQGHFSLTYEASMTRLYRDGRTETVRSCTIESCAFVNAMLDENSNKNERLQLLQKAGARHQDLYRDAMCGKGVDRHLFALYVVSRYLEEESPFFNKIFPPTYSLSTSQTPLTECADMPEVRGLTREQISALRTSGGGFGPVADNGYGVSYIFSGEHQIAFHISSKKSAPNTSSFGFREDLLKSLRDMRELFEQQ
uniref:carnitine O-palmitoyltransferase n=1 Tax=Acrobeloides nanus TaxID=290746 RepID=A0A914ENB6_9BILA